MSSTLLDTTRDAIDPIAIDTADAPIGGPIIVGTDGDPDANGAIRLAHLLAERDGARVHVVGVLEPSPAYLLTQERLPAETDAARTAALQKRVERQMRRLEMPAKCWDLQLTIGQTADVIADFSIQMHAALALVGIGTHGVLGRVWGTDTAIRVVQRTRTPVMAVNRYAASLPRCAVVGMDFSPASIAATRAVLRAMAPDSVVHVIHVQPLLSLLAEGNTSINLAYEQELAEQLSTVTEMLTPHPGIRVVHETATGDPSRCLIEIAEREAADLVAVGIHGYGGLPSWIVGGVANRVMRSAKCSVLIAPEMRARLRMTRGPGMARTVVSTVPSQWAQLLTDFTSRNAERPTTMEVDDPTIGAQAEERGYHLRGVAYDHRDGRAEMMLGGRTTGPHLTHTISQVDEVAIVTRPDGRDAALRITAGESATILAFLD